MFSLIRPRPHARHGAAGAELCYLLDHDQLCGVKKAQNKSRILPLQLSEARGSSIFNSWGQ